ARTPENPGKPAGEWEVVAKKPRAARRGRPDAVIVQANGKFYSEVLAMVTRRGDKQLSALGACVSKVRRTNNGNLLLEVARGSVESAETMKESIERVLGDSATVRASTENTKVLVLEIRNIDSITSKDEVCAAIAGQFNFEVGRVRVRSMRRGHSETQLAVVSLPIPLGKAVLQRGEVRIGWSMCRIRERPGPPRAAQDLLTQTVRERGSEVAILSEPYRIGNSRDWATDRTGKAALWLCGVGAQQMCHIKAADGFVRANVGGTAGAGSVIDLTFVSSALARRARWTIGEVYTASDHEAIECSLGMTDRPSGPPPLPRRAFRQDTFRPR
ncbi:hypothetical protein KR059_000699, partial [Drosophila kikkawai]